MVSVEQPAELKQALNFHKIKSDSEKEAGTLYMWLIAAGSPRCGLSRKHYFNFCQINVHSAVMAALYV